MNDNYFPMDDLLTQFYLWFEFVRTFPHFSLKYRFFRFVSFQSLTHSFDFPIRFIRDF